MSRPSDSHRSSRVQRVLTRLWNAWRSNGLGGVWADVRDILARLWRRTWVRFWMQFAGVTRFGRMATRFAGWFAPPYRARVYLCYMNRKGYVSPRATLYHKDVRLGENVFIGDGVLIFQAGENSGPVEIGDRARLWGDSFMEIGDGGSITLGPQTRVNPGVKLYSHIAPIRIGCDVGLSTNCVLYSYDHGIAPDTPYLKQPLETKGPIIIEDHAWLGTNVIVLSGVRIGRGAVIAAGSVVTRDVPDNAVAAGVPARVVKMRGEIAGKHSGRREWTKVGSQDANDA